ncbi:LysR substrate-binding domain-containing protein [Pseudomonas sp.]|uniref:LysR substrate-binding domain-containing protein n=1 Tax=Pseudomonas sp. TaxID=306 RepID=UPI0024874624|nr:LysR substrate-binding domain-containing protein [Pseudomonas sp.]MDI1332512.1 LysR substrate-binding domain-containing protein [Pseudomonas sp.]
MAKLPPLSALRAFESAARLKSVSKAATELNVTHPAISHQIKQLERHFGQSLLVKKGRGISVTDAGEELCTALTNAFDNIETACTRLSSSPQRTTLVVASLASVASRWLIPLLPNFTATHPEVQIRVVYASRTTENIDPDIDILIRYCDGPYIGQYAAHHLLSGATRPVCSNTLLERIGPLQTPADFLKTNLLHDENNHAWQEWFVSAGYPVPVLDRGMVFEDFNLMSTAAIASHGIALCPTDLIQDDIARKNLVVLSGITANRERSYLLLHRTQCNPIVAEFRDWLLQEVPRYFQSFK